MAQKRISSLGSVFITGMASAVAAYFLWRPARDWVAGQKISFPAGWDVPLVYGVVFFLSYVVLAFVFHRLSVRVSRRAMGKVAVQGISPYLARMVLVAFLFAGPLYVVMAPQAAKNPARFTEIIEKGTKKMDEKQVGYKKDARNAMDALVGDAVEP